MPKKNKHSQNRHEIRRHEILWRWLQYAVLSPDWKYAVNLAGSEMVLTTNRWNTDRVNSVITDKIGDKKKKTKPHLADSVIESPIFVLYTLQIFLDPLNKKF